MSKPLIPSKSLLGLGSLTERGKSSHGIIRDKDHQSPNMFNFKSIEEKQKHDEFIKKIKDQEKERRKLLKKLKK